MQRAIAAAPGIGAAREGLGPLEVGQKVGVAPTLGPAIVGRRMTRLIGERIDDARTAQNLAARIGNHAAIQTRLRHRLIAPVQRAARQRGPLRRVGGTRGSFPAPPPPPPHPPPPPTPPPPPYAAPRT